MAPFFPPPRGLRFDAWPAADRAAWLCALVCGDPFDAPTPAAGWRPATLEKTRKGYSAWLGFLTAHAVLDPAQAPAARVTRPRLRAYYRFLCAAGNAPLTITGRFDDLARALRLLAPGTDWGWVRRPDGQAIRTLQPQTPRPKPPPPDSGVLAAWACDLMDTAQAAPAGPTAWLRYRDGLFIAMLAWRARRVGSMALLRVGWELLTELAGYRIELTAAQVKTKKPDRFGLPADLTPYIGHYLAVVRPALLAGQSGDALWISQQGRRLSAKSLADRVYQWTGLAFGQRFGPHRFRHAASTTAVLRDPGQPGLAAALLGISAPVIEQHYNLAGQVADTTALANLIAARRRHYAAQRPRQPRAPRGGRVRNA